MEYNIVFIVKSIDESSYTEIADKLNKKNKFIINKIYDNGVMLNNTEIELCIKCCSILIDTNCSQIIKKQLIDRLKLHTTVKYLQSSTCSIAIVSDTQNVIGEYSKNEFGRTGIDKIVISELLVEKTARIAYELSTEYNYNLVNIDHANSLASSFIWRKIINDINEDYPNIYLENILIENFVFYIDKYYNKKCVFLANTLTEPILQSLLKHTFNYTIVGLTFMNDTTQGLFEINKQSINETIEILTNSILQK